MFRVSLSDSLLQTIFVPGVIFLVAIGWIAIPYIWISLPSSIGDLLETPGNLAESGALITGVLLLGGLLAYILAMFLGLLLAVCIGYLEYYRLDDRQRRKLELPSDEY